MIEEIKEIMPTVEEPTLEELKQKIENKKKRISRLHYRSFKVDKETSHLLDQIQEHNREIEKSIKNSEKTEDYKEFFLLKKKFFIKKIGDLEKELINTEIKVLDLPSVTGNPLLEEIVKNFNDQIIKERNKNRKLGVYVKQDFSQSRKEKIEVLKKEITSLTKSIQKKKKEVKDFESKQLKFIHSLCALDLFLEEVKGEISQCEND